MSMYKYGKEAVGKDLKAEDEHKKKKDKKKKVNT